MKKSTMYKTSRFKEADLGVFNTPESDLVMSEFTKGSRIIGLTNGCFSLIDLIHSVLKKIGKSEVICTTWSAGIKDANQVAWMVSSNLITSFTMIVDHSFATRQNKYALSITDLFGKENIRTSEVHAKFVLIQNGEMYVTIRTSMNLNANKTCESFEIDEDKNVFDFYKSFVSHTIKDMPEGFCSDTWRANESIKKFFNVEQNKSKSWTEI